MSEITRIKQLVDRAKTGSTISVQGEVIRSLIAEVDQFVQAIDEDHRTVEEAKKLPREIAQLKQEEGKDAEIAEAEQTMKDAAELERTLRAKRDLLRKINSDVQALRSSIARGLK